MSIQPQGELLRRAIKWVSEERKEHPDKKHAILLDEACLRFNLTPKDAETLARYTKDDLP